MVLGYNFCRLIDPPRLECRLEAVTNFGALVEFDLYNSLVAIHLLLDLGLHDGGKLALRGLIRSTVALESNLHRHISRLRLVLRLRIDPAQVLLVGDQRLHIEVCLADLDLWWLQLFSLLLV